MREPRGAGQEMSMQNELLKEPLAKKLIRPLQRLVLPSYGNIRVLRVAEKSIWAWL